MMNPSTGDILAMATYPDYDLNTPFTPTNTIRTNNWDELNINEKNDLLYKMWNNSACQSTYEPGSTFKLLTAAIALEENLITPDNHTDFYCSGSEKVSALDIACWRNYEPHQHQSLREALANSCNPAFIQLGRKIGAQTLYKYYEAFGLFSRTNSNLYGESNSVFHNLDNVRDIELATMSFGQRFTITPLQLITAISAIANEGVLMQPNIIKEIKNTNTGSTKARTPQEIRQVISKETAETMMDMLGYVVTDGTGRYANVPGYSIGGKSGTSEPLETNKNDGYVASFVGVSPTVNSQVVILVILYNPKGESHQGGQVAGPVVSQILTEVLPHIGISSDEFSNSTTSTSNEPITVPDVRNKTISEAKNLLSKFNVVISGNEDINNTIIIDQVPKPGVALQKNSNIFLYTTNNDVKTSVTVPNLKGMSAAQAMNALSAKNLNIVINGSGIIISQDISANKEVEQGTVVTVTLQPAIDGGY